MRNSSFFKDDSCQNIGLAIAPKYGDGGYYIATKNVKKDGLMVIIDLIPGSLKSLLGGVDV